MALPWEDDAGIPACLKRDANNRAPWMNADFKPHKHYSASPAANPPANPPNWVPPWAASSPLPDA
jgi:hypothetical protein